ncbi:MAG TPA: hypothetical protein VLG27_05020 [Candidatus Saccharimonadia bacterium]|nr:hypothetical protein [Candidatus Saccharimonadia bacterium]
MPKDKLRKMERLSELNRAGREISNVLLEGGNPTNDGLKVTLDATKPLHGKSVTSYWVIEAQDKAEAVELSRSAPLYEGGAAELYEIVTEG